MEKYYASRYILVKLGHQDEGGALYGRHLELLHMLNYYAVT